jgi:hypothetical protein
MNLNKKRVVVICSLDGFANSVRPVEIKKYLEKDGHTVTLINTSQSAKTKRKDSIYSIILSGVNKTTGYLLLLCTKKYIKSIFSPLHYFYLILKMKIRAHKLYALLKDIHFDVIICENTYDSFVFTKIINRIKILDLPSPLADEIYYSNQLSNYFYKKFNSFLNNIYIKADYLSFHWNSYTNYVRRNSYSGKNTFEMNWGCNPKKEIDRARYNKNVKIVFLGKLSGEWVNKPLLSNLTKLYGKIDVYGAPCPEKVYGLNYKGYAPSLDVIKNYQFGLITISKDKLRKNSFSSKHLEYLSYGLPVLTPDWRKDPLLKDVSIYYNESNFLDVINIFSQKYKWKTMSNKCHEKAKAWEWEKALNPLKNVINMSDNIKDFNYNNSSKIS